MGRIAEEEREKVQVRLDKIEQIFCINSGDLNQYYVLLTRGIDGIRLGFWDGNDSFRKYMEDTLDIGA